MRPLDLAAYARLRSLSSAAAGVAGGLSPLQEGRRPRHPRLRQALHPRRRPGLRSARRYPRLELVAAEAADGRHLREERLLHLVAREGHGDDHEDRDAHEEPEAGELLDPARGSDPLKGDRGDQAQPDRRRRAPLAVDEDEGGEGEERGPRAEEPVDGERHDEDEEEGEERPTRGPGSGKPVDARRAEETPAGGTWSVAWSCSILKPAAEVYRHAADSFGVAPVEVRLVAAHSWDVAGAMRAGCKAAFVARPGMVLDPLFEPPDIVGPDLGAVSERIVAVDARNASPLAGAFT